MQSILKNCGKELHLRNLKYLLRFALEVILSVPSANFCLKEIFIFLLAIDRVFEIFDFGYCAFVGVLSSADCDWVSLSSRTCNQHALVQPVTQSI